MTTGLMRWTPETDVFRSRMDRVFNEMLRDAWGAPLSESVAGRTWTPAVDIKESDEALTLTAELPGFDKEHWPDLNDLEYAQGVYRQWGATPYWT